MHDPFNLQRFVEAQDPVIERVMAELLAGRKTSHWIWFVFPQIQGLGHSPAARRYAIASADEARAYLVHPVLGPRLQQAVQALLQHKGKSAEQILGHPDDLKLRSSLTLFIQVAPQQPLLEQALEQFYTGEPDDRTLALLAT